MKEIVETLTLADGSDMAYFVFVPNDLKGPLPMILYLHGIGERGNDIQLVKRFGLPKYLKNMELPYVVVVPQCQDGYFWDYHLRDVERIMDQVIQTYPVDENRVCLMGTSMGAFGAWNYMIQRPERFQCLVSVAGGVMLPTDDNLKRIREKRFLLYHGVLDEVVPIANSLVIYQKLNQLGGNVMLKVFEKENHFLTSHAFKDPNLWKWVQENI